MRTRLRFVPALAFAVAVLALSLTWGWSAYGNTNAQSSGGCRTFPETGHKVCGRFLDYWQSHGGLPQQGYPLSEEFTETSALNGLPYVVQYFERAVFEYHPENKPPYDVELSQLGTYLGKQLYTQGFPAAAGVTPFYEDRTEAVNALKSYYNAINREEYQRAYGYFDGAPNPPASLAPSYDKFVQGYANTVSVTLAYGKEFVGAAAGSIYDSLPVFLTAKHTDGSTHAFAGCYTLRRTNEGISPNPADLLWRIYSADLSEVPANTAPSAALNRSCNQ
ncbi:MAG: hypothetical protein ACJ78Q_08020 [Chloroflexia bacterium]